MHDFDKALLYIRLGISIIITVLTFRDLFSALENILGPTYCKKDGVIIVPNQEARKPLPVPRLSYRPAFMISSHISAIITHTHSHITNCAAVGRPLQIGYCVCVCVL